MVKLFSSTGRANRAYYFWHTFLEGFALITGLVIVSLVIQLSLHLLGIQMEEPEGIPLFIFIVLVGSLLLAAIASEIGVTTRRLHDLDRSGWHYLLLLVPLYNIYFSLVLLFKKGTQGPNAYGPDPLQKALQCPNSYLGKNVTI